MCRWWYNIKSLLFIAANLFPCRTVSKILRQQKRVGLHSAFRTKRGKGRKKKNRQILLLYSCGFSVGDQPLRSMKQTSVSTVTKLLPMRGKITVGGCWEMFADYSDRVWRITFHKEAASDQGDWSLIRVEQSFLSSPERLNNWTFFQNSEINICLIHHIEPHCSGEAQDINHVLIGGDDEERGKLHSGITKQSVGKHSSPQFFSLMPTAAVGLLRPKCAYFKALTA